MSIDWLGGMDSFYLFCYATGNIISGFIEDRMPLRFLISGGLLCSSLLYSVIIILGYSNAYLPWLFFVTWGLQGLVQSTVWPGTVAVLGHWFTRTHRGKIMGAWSSCGSFGNIVGALIGGLILSFNQSWMVVTLTFALFQAAIGLLFLFTVFDKPSDYGLASAGTKNISVNSVEDGFAHASGSHSTGMPFMQALSLPGVVPFALCFACVKSLYYGLSMWLPYFLDKRINHPDLIGTMASLLNVGAVIGSMVCGWLGDWLRFRSPVIVLFLGTAIPLLLLYEVGNEEIYWMYFIVILLTGFFLAGASNIIASAAAADLAQQEKVPQGVEAMATVAGIVDGAGGYGAAISTYVIGQLGKVAWVYVFVFMMVLCAAAIGCILHIAISDIRKIKRQREMKLGNKLLDYKD
jgi:MFS transporter, OPA family, solute carrier family 37 (glycerol-3-phosphate transporter), member 3